MRTKKKINRIKWILGFWVGMVCCFGGLSAQEKKIVIRGKVKEEKTDVPLANAIIDLKNSSHKAHTNAQGMFKLEVPFVSHVTLQCLLYGYEASQKNFSMENRKSDTLEVNWILKPKMIELEGVDVFASKGPDTIVGTQAFSILDFDFYNDGFIMVTEDRQTGKLHVQLLNEHRDVLSKIPLPVESADFKEIYKDFVGYHAIITRQKIFRLVVDDLQLFLVDMPFEDYQQLVMPIVDTLDGKILFSDYDRHFPAFSYYTYEPKDSTRKKVKYIEDKDLMENYRFEYYFLKPRERLEARIIEKETGIDKFKAAAYLSGFTGSMFYTPLFAPLFVVGDTIRVFDHYADKLFHIRRDGLVIDSFPIHYHHPKKWKEWKRSMVKDGITDEVYAVFEKDGHKYLKLISCQNGEEKGKYALMHHSATRLKIRDGFVYYIYRPFESRQEKYMYRERIVLKAE